LPPKIDKYTGAPMDLANMRANGVHPLLALCLDRHHEANVNVDHLPGHIAVPSLSCRMKCSKWSSKRITVRQAWGTSRPASNDPVLGQS